MVEPINKTWPYIFTILQPGQRLKERFFVAVTILRERFAMLKPDKVLGAKHLAKGMYHYHRRYC